VRLRPLICFALALPLTAQTPILPLNQVHAGMKGIGRTVFQGNTVEEFSVEVLGVLENIGPKQSVIIARMEGGPLGHTGVIQGMSGSPVYIDGRLAGAVALSFAFAKDAIAGIRPIEEMLAVPTQLSAAVPTRARGEWPPDPALALPKPVEVSAGAARFVEIATPLWLSGFTQSTLDRFLPVLRASGFVPVQGVSGGGRPPSAMGDPASLKPGSMISVQLMSGDLGAGADGTVTCIEGNKIYAFGHRFMSVGATDLPFARSDVITVLADQQMSFKISTPKEWMGAITNDSNTALTGVLGRRAQTLPVHIRMAHAGAKPLDYNIEMASDRLLAPLLLQMAIFSVIEATERTVGPGSVRMRGSIVLEGPAPAVHIENLYSGELGAPNLASAAAAAPLAALLQSGFPALRPKRLEIELEVVNERRALQIDSVWASPREVRPGETVEIGALFAGEGGVEITRTARYKIPLGAPVGSLSFTVTDGAAANFADYRQFLFAPPHSQEQLLDFLNGLRPNTKAFVRVWRQHPSWLLQGETLPDPPPSAALLFSKSASAQYQPNSRVAELEMDGGGYLLLGSKTAQVEVKE
jgi:hypothetical protein